MSVPERNLVYLLATSPEIALATRGETWSSVQVNQASSDWHVDTNNTGYSYIVAFGDYSGGRLLTEDAALDLRNQVWRIDGSKRHASESYKGSRTSLVIFTHANVARLPADDRAYLSLIGIPWRKELSNLCKPPALLEHGKLELSLIHI